MQTVGYVGACIDHSLLLVVLSLKLMYCTRRHRSCTQSSSCHKKVNSYRLWKSPWNQNWAFSMTMLALLLSIS